MLRGSSIAVLVLALQWPAIPSHAQTKPAPWSAPRTAGGQPDLQGIWTNATLTPLERPASMKDKAFLTEEEEAAAIEKRTAENRAATDKMGPLASGSYNRAWYDDGTRVLATRQTSLVVDPGDGRVPVKPSAEARRDDYAARNSDSYEFMSPWDRCITRGIPGSMFPAGYNNAYQIIQTPGYVTIHYEMIHDARIIPLDNRPRSARMQTWMGEPRGRWDGDTLVVETMNYHDKGWITTSAASGRIKGIPHSDQLHVIERFRRVSKDVINYSATITDPAMYARPWTIAFPLSADPDYRIYEYACHEGNYAIENILRGARALDKAATKSPK